ncbi:hypothetical protein E4T52_16788 [Aureobasidium sp. EXF-3400]|nr:hypothetical protein E4T51_16078 [Aureobasidium sp. EXF-12344]KAI4768107.1 hypothetical protein E4T52_16788 [Aureobasidium sp. EXF-3400]
MGKGSCYCGKIAFSFSGEPANKAICHCTDCRKISGSAFTTNIIIPTNQFSVDSGTPKKFSAKADSGRTVTTVFCGDCGSNLWREGDMSTAEGILVVRAGVLDGEGALDEAGPKAEVYTCERAGWLEKIGGSEQFEKFF